MIGIGIGFKKKPGGGFTKKVLVWAISNNVITYYNKWIHVGKKLKKQTLENEPIDEIGKL